MAEVFGRLRRPFMIALSIYLGHEIVDASLEPDSSMLRNTLEGIRDVLLLPFNIAVFRLLILGEAASQYSFAIFLPRFQRLLGWTIGLWSVASILLPYAMNLITPSNGIQLVATVVIIVISLAFMIRIAILLPAIAVDASGATVRSALADTDGRSWLILKAFFITFLPLLLTIVLLVGLVLLGIVSHVSGLSHWSAFPRIILAGLIGFLTYAATAVTAARLFDWIGDHVKGAAQS